jgi:hypothetical protein
MIKILFFLLALLSTGSAFSQSNLPACQGTNPDYWNGCIGTQKIEGVSYYGQYKNGIPHGEFVRKRPEFSSVSNATQVVASSIWLPSSNLPRCEGSDVANWNSCIGVMFQQGLPFAGQFRNGIPYGQFEKVADSGTQMAQMITAPQQLPSQLTAQERQRLENEKLREEAAVARQRQRELEEQLRQAQQGSSIPTQTTSIGTIGRRIALVVGNANYKVRPLKNPRNDADDVSRSLKATGFDVIDLRDASLAQMRTAVRQFGDRLINNDVGLVYYSGHGVEVKGRNYFIPVNADIQREDEIADQGLDVSLILEKMSTAGKGVNILIVDACRDDPFGRSFRSSSRGLATMDAPRGTIIAYATSPGRVASDGDPRERNSPYTKHLVKAMQSPNKPIEQVFKEVRRAVQDETRNQQTPWENTSLSGDFFFRIQK